MFSMTETEKGLEFVQGGQTAYRELRSYGLENTWVCQMGLEILDGSFKDFQEKVLGLDLSAENLQISLYSLRGERLSFGWENSFVVNSQEQPLAGFKHYENNYCLADMPASQLDIVFKDEGIRLKFA